MGGDGQALINNRKLLESLYKQKPDADGPTRRMEVCNRLRYCALSHQPIRRDAVCCDLEGKLYNKDAVVEFLIEQKSAPVVSEKRSTRITRLRDVKDLVVPPPAATAATGGDEDFDLMCPLTKLLASAGVPFACNWSCGHCVAVSALGTKEACEWVKVGCPVSDCAAVNSGDAIWVLLLLDDDAGMEQRDRLTALTRKRKQRE